MMRPDQHNLKATPEERYSDRYCKTCSGDGVLREPVNHGGPSVSMTCFRCHGTGQE